MRQQTHQRGFTLVELIMVIVLMGVIGGMVSVFMKSPIDAYVDSARRAALTDVADTAVRRMARDIRKALPNSIRTPTTTPPNQCVEFIPTKTGGRYRAQGAGALSFVAPGSSTFNMLGSNLGLPSDQRIASGDALVVYNLGISGSDAYQQPSVNRAVVSTPITEAAVETSIPLTATTLFPLESGSNRFHVVPGGENVVSYVCIGGQLRRTVSTFAGPSTSCTASGAILASNVSSCNFVYNGSDLQRNALVQLTIKFTDSSGEAVSLYHEVHVDNTP